VSNRECKAVAVWEKDGLVFSVVKHHAMGHYCGYVRFPRRPVKEKEYGGIITYVPVHGGITYAKESEDGSVVYGFDCAHCGDWSFVNPGGKKWTLEEVKLEAEKMAEGIKLAAEYEKHYLQCTTNRGKAKVVDEFHRELGVRFDVTDNFGAMLNLLSGEL